MHITAYMKNFCRNLSMRFGLLCVLVTVICLFLAPAHALAKAYELCAAADEYIASYGFFDGTEGVIDVSFENFSKNTDSLFIAYVADGAMHCAVFDNTDGLMLTDELMFDTEATVGLGTDGSVTCINADNKSYILIDDAFVQSRETYKTSREVMRKSNSKITALCGSPEEINNLLNSNKKHAVADYGFENLVDTISDAAKEEIHNVIAACADLMSYDCLSYSFDDLFCNVLNTNENYRILSEKSADTDDDTDIGYKGIYRVNSEYIDDIFTRYFDIIPEKPPVNALASRGFCYSGGVYFYTKKYRVSFSTQVNDIVGIYEPQKNIYFCVFQDVYTESGIKKPEYSYCFLQLNSGKNIRVLRMEMGKPILSEHEVKAYAENFAPSEHCDEAASPEPLLFLFGAALIFIILFWCLLFKKHTGTQKQ